MALAVGRVGWQGWECLCLSQALGSNRIPLPGAQARKKWRECVAPCREAESIICSWIPAFPTGFTRRAPRPAPPWWLLKPTPSTS